MGAGKAHHEKFGGWARRGQGYFRYFRNWGEAGQSSLADVRFAAELRSAWTGPERSRRRASAPTQAASTRLWAKFLATREATLFPFAARRAGLCFPYERRIVGKEYCCVVVPGLSKHTSGRKPTF